MGTTTPDGGYSHLTHDDAPAVPLDRRPRLPSGRAVVGGLMVAVAGLLAFVVASGDESAPATSYLVAARPIAAGAMVSGGDLILEAMTLPEEVAANSIGSAAGADGAVATRDLQAGELISVGDLIAAPQVAGTAVGRVHEISMPVDRERISARTSVGDKVTVLVTTQLGGMPVTLVAIQDALVLSWDAESGSGGRGILTLAPSDASTVMALAHLIRQGDVTVVRSTRATDDAYPSRYPSLEPGPQGSSTAGSPGAFSSAAADAVPLEPAP